MKKDHYTAVRLLRSWLPDMDMDASERDVLEVLRRRGGEMWTVELLSISAASPSTLNTLEKKGAIAIWRAK